MKLRLREDKWLSQGHPSRKCDPSLSLNHIFLPSAKILIHRRESTKQASLLERGKEEEEERKERNIPNFFFCFHFIKFSRCSHFIVVLWNVFFSPSKCGSESYIWFAHQCTIELFLISMQWLVSLHFVSLSKTIIQYNPTFYVSLKRDSVDCQ